MRFLGTPFFFFVNLGVCEGLWDFRCHLNALALQVPQPAGVLHPRNAGPLEEEMQLVGEMGPSRVATGLRRGCFGSVCCFVKGNHVGLGWLFDS